MRRLLVLTLGCLLLAARPSAPQAAATAPHVLLAPADVKFGPGPPALPPGSTLAVLYGDPGQAAPFGLRAQLPAGYRIPPHWHPTAEHLTIVSGTIAFGMGEKFDESTMKTLPAGGYAEMPAEMRHYLKVQAAAVLEVHAMGPFVVTYVNPADDPRAAARAK